MTEEFNKWWNADQGYDGVTNPYRSDSAVYWAWEGWQAAVKAEREACAKVCEKRADRYVKTKGYMFSVGAQDCADHIRARGNHEDR
jgi:hypothetical protein